MIELLNVCKRIHEEHMKNLDQDELVSRLSELAPEMAPEMYRACRLALGAMRVWEQECHPGMIPLEVDEAIDALVAVMQKVGE